MTFGIVCIYLTRRWLTVEVLGSFCRQGGEDGERRGGLNEALSFLFLFFFFLL